MILDRLKKEKQEETISDEDYVSRKEFNKLKRRIKAHQYFLDNIYVFYSLEPTPFLREIRNFAYELMELSGHLCDKHGLDYWIDFDTLLNAVRNGEFMPENLSLNVGMMKSDSVKFEDIFQSEMDNKVAYEFERTLGCLKINFKFDELEDFSFALNIFTYDYLDDESIALEGEDARPFRADVLYPLGAIELENRSYSVPHDAFEYLKNSNENYIFSLGSVPDFNRLKGLKQQPDTIEILRKYNEMLRASNENFR